MAMKYSAGRIELDKVQKEAEELYRGGFYCSEAILQAVRQNFGLECPDEIIAMASGMPVGIGRSGCTCGALSGGVMALGCFFGRTVPGGPQDPDSIRCMQMSKELHDWFREANGKHSACCRVLTRGFDMSKGEHKEQCIRFTGICARKVAEIVCRELDIPAV